jgi:hypothetical protein
MKYSTTETLNNIGYGNLKHDIGQQTITLKQWQEVRRFVSYKQQEELKKMLEYGIESYEKQGLKVSKVTREIFKDIKDFLEDLPF